jgi:hypothetical protein
LQGEYLQKNLKNEDGVAAFMYLSGSVENDSSQQSLEIVP